MQNHTSATHCLLRIQHIYIYQEIKKDLPILQERISFLFFHFSFSFHYFSYYESSLFRVDSGSSTEFMCDSIN